MSDILARVRVVEGTTAEWTANNLILGDGELAIERQAAGPVVRMGDGVTQCLSCPILAPLNNPAFTGNPTAPTAAIFDNDTSIATTAFVKRQLGGVAGVFTLTADTTLVGTSHAGLLLALSSTGNQNITLPLANTMPAGNAFVFYAWNTGTWTLNRSGSDAIVRQDNFNAQNVTLRRGDFCTLVSNGNQTWYINAGVQFAPLASPVFTGDPQAPTPATADNDTSIATTAYVKANLANYATLASPALSGDPTAPTPATADNDTSIATTAYVKNNLASYATIASLANYAPLASPALTGNPTAPTAALGDNDTSIATTAYVVAQILNMIATAQTPGAAFTPTFANSFFDGGSFRAYKTMRMATIQGKLSRNGGWPLLTNICTLPAAYRPITEVGFPVMVTFGNFACQMVGIGIQPDGTVNTIFPATVLGTPDANAGTGVFGFTYPTAS